MQIPISTYVFSLFMINPEPLFFTFEIFNSLQNMTKIKLEKKIFNFFQNTKFSHKIISVIIEFCF